MIQRPFTRGTVSFVVHRLYLANAAAAGFVLIMSMIMFGILTSSIAAALAFPIALPSMAIEGDAWGIWMLSPIYLAPILFLVRFASRERDSVS